MTPGQLGDLVRGVTALVQGGVLVAWLYVLVRSRELESGFVLSRWAIRAVAGIFLLFTYLTIQALAERHGQPPSSPVIIVALYLVLVVGLVVEVMRSLWRSGQ